MCLLNVPMRRAYAAFMVTACALTILFMMGGAAIQGQQSKFDVLIIGATSAGPKTTDKKAELSEIETLQNFIKEETGFKNEIIHFKDWRELAAKMEKKEIHLGVFQGYEFAWANENKPYLQPLAVAVNVYVYPVAYVVVNKTNAAKDIGGLQNQSIALPNTGQRFVKVFVDKQCYDRGKSPKEFFSKINTPDNVEDALDDVVDGVLQAVAADRASLEAYKRRKPARFTQLKEVAQSQRFPPPVVAYYKGVMDDKVLMRFEEGLLQARSKEKGQSMLTLFKLTGFEKVPDDFGKVLAETRKNYPPPPIKAK